MMSTKDGKLCLALAGSGMHRHGRRLLLSCVVFACAVSLGLLPGSQAGIAYGEPAISSTGFAPAVCAVANRAMTLGGEPVPPRTSDSAVAIPNRPVALAVRAPTAPAEEGPARPADPESLQLTMSVPPVIDAAGTAALAMADPPVRAADAAPAQRENDSIIESVDVSGLTTEHITIARNSVAFINMRVPLNRAEIADPNIAGVVVQSPTRLVVAGKEVGTTQLILTIGEEQRVFKVTVELDLAVLQDLIYRQAPAADVQVRSVGGNVVLSGFVPDASTGERLVQLATLVQGGEVTNQLTVAGVQQTMLRVVVAEVNKVALRELGVNWAMGGSDLSRDFFFANNLGQLNPTTIGSSGVADVLSGQQVYSMAATANLATTNLTFGFPRAEFQMFINALRQNGLSKILAEPNLVAISGQTAQFLAGGEVPIPVTQGGSTAGAVTIIYKEFGVRLAFTPTVMGGQIVRIHVMSEVSEAIPSGQLTGGGLPTFTFNTRRVESTIECGNGQTFAIAGLLDDRVRASADKIPGLGDIPILGTLFSSTQYRKSETELLFLVTPQLVEPLDPHQVPAPPGSLTTDPNDYELFALQRLEGENREAPTFDRVPRREVPVNTRPGDASGWNASPLALRGPWGLADFEESQ